MKIKKMYLKSNTQENFRTFEERDIVNGIKLDQLQAEKTSLRGIVLPVKSLCVLSCQNDTIRTVSVGDVVVVREEDQPRRKWRVGKILDLILGSDGCTRGGLVQVRSKGGKCTKLRRPVQRLYPLEIQCEVPVQQTAEVSSSQNPDPVSTEVRTKQPVSTRSCARRAAAVEADRRKTTWLEDLT